MSIHWPTKALDPAGRVEAIRAAYTPGASLKLLGQRLGTSRNAIAGVYHRARGELADCPLMTPGEVREASRRRKAEPRKPEPKPVSRALPAPRVQSDESHGAGRPLMMLAARQCKWPVNEAERGQEHLFCGLPAEGSYCAHHAARGVTTPDKAGWGYK